MIIARTFVALLALQVPGLLMAQQTIIGSFMYDGLQRDHRLYVPAAYSPGTAVPLVFNLHGYTSDNAQQEFYGDFRPIADTANFLIVHPNGTIDGFGNRFWNTFGGSSVDDIGYLMALLDTISAHYDVDPDRVYSTGMSNGGFMSYELACYASDRIAAIASVTGTMTNVHLAACAATHPTPVMQVHGTADPTVNYNGGGGTVAVESLVLTWAQFNNCSTTPVITQVPNTVTTDGCTAERWVYQGGDAGSTVELFKVLGGGHTWPGAAIAIGVTNQDFDASNEIWRFFSQYRLDELLADLPESSSGAAFTLVADPSGRSVHLAFTESRTRSILVHDAMGRVCFESTSASSGVDIPVQSGLWLISIRSERDLAVRRVLMP